MRFFCTQPDVIEDAHDFRYQPKSSVLPTKVSGSHHGHGINGHPGYGNFGPGLSIPANYNPNPQNHDGQSGLSGRSSNDTGHHLASDIANMDRDSPSNLNRSRTSLSVFNGKKMFRRRGTIANPGPGIGNGDSSDLTSGSDGIPKDNDKDKDKDKDKKKKRSSHRISAPLTSGIRDLLHDHDDHDKDKDKDSGKKDKDKDKKEGYISGTDGEKKRKRISKQHIGAPEGFRHEAHFGHGATWTKDGDQDGWNVETWRAEIEKMVKPTDGQAHANRPRGPRQSGEHQHQAQAQAQGQYQHTYQPYHAQVALGITRAATVGAGPKGRPTTAPERAIPLTAMNMSGGDRGDRSGDRGDRSGDRGEKGEKGNKSGRGHSHSKSYSGGHSYSRSRSPTDGYPATHTQAQAPPDAQISPLYAHLDAHVQAHALAQANALANTNALTQANTQANAQIQAGAGIPGFPAKLAYTHAKSPSVGTNGSLGSSNFSSPTSAVSNSTYSTQPIIVSTTGNTGNSGNSGSLSRSQSEKPYHGHSHGHGHGHSSSYDYGKKVSGTNASNSGSLGRSASAHAALPPSLPAASSTSTQSYASYGSYASSSSAQNAMRRPIPSQRRKPVPQHLPATVEVSPFPTLLIEPKEDGSLPIPDFPFEIADSGNEGGNTSGVGSGTDGSAAYAAYGAYRSRRREDARDSRDSRDSRDRDGRPSRDRRDSADRRDSSDRRDSRDSRDRDRDRERDRGSREPRERRGSKSKGIPKEMVPLLGVPGEDARYVTKSVKGRWDGNMAEIMNALRDEPAPPAIVKLPQHI